MNAKDSEHYFTVISPPFMNMPLETNEQKKVSCLVCKLGKKGKLADVLG